MTSPSTNSRSLAAAGPVLLLVIAGLLLAVWTIFQTGTTTAGPERLVVYCAHDAVYAEAILRQFEQQTGLRVDVQFDTEATKSLGLVQQLMREAPVPRCDVFWNNELLGMIELQDQGLLEPYRGAGWQRLPVPYRDAAGHWVGFGARLRVYIVNTDLLPATTDAIKQTLSGDLSEVAIARPMFGTTLTQYSLLWSRNADELQAWHRDVRLRGIKEVKGNAMVKDVVAAGSCRLGFTDTDDFFVALDDRAPVAMLPIRVSGQTICIPNTAGIIRGTRHRAAAEKLVDYLASAETELALANSKSRQIPLGPVNAEAVPAEVRPLIAWARDGADLSQLVTARRDCLSWLKAETSGQPLP